jgi:Tfp pilus assembly protein PilO
MRIGRGERLWLAGGGAAALVLFLLGWFFLIGPQRAETASLRDQKATAEQELARLRAHLAELTEQSGKLPQYQSDLTRAQQALPSDPALSDFLRELSAAGDATGVSVTDVAAGKPTTVIGQGSAIAVTVAVDGTFGALNRFVDQLQQVQPRAVLIGTGSIVPAGKDGKLTGSATLNLGLVVFTTSGGTGASASPTPSPTPSRTG